MSETEHPIRPLGLDHLVIRATDIATMTRFYCDVLGCTETRMRDDIGLYHLQAGHSMIDLADVAAAAGQRGGPAPGPDGNNIDHFAIRIVDFDAERLRAHLTAHGVEAGEIMTRFGAAGDGPSLYLKDPEGNTVELKGYPEAG